MKDSKRIFKVAAQYPYKQPELTFIDYDTPDDKLMEYMNAHFGKGKGNGFHFGENDQYHLEGHEVEGGYSNAIYGVIEKKGVQFPNLELREDVKIISLHGTYELAKQGLFHAMTVPERDWSEDFEMYRTEIDVPSIAGATSFSINEDGIEVYWKEGYQIDKIYRFDVIHI